MGEATLAVQLKPTSEFYTILIQRPGQYAFLNYELARVHAGEQKLEARSIGLEPSAHKNMRIHSIGATRADTEVIAQAGGILIQSPSLKAEIPLTSFKSLIATLDKCRTLLLADWGFAGKEQELLGKFPEPAADIRKYIDSDVYPPASLVNGQVGTVSARASVGLDGRASNCIIFKSSGHQPLDRAACAAMTQRVRYKPAQTKGGEPMVAPFEFTMRFLMR